MSFRPVYNLHRCECIFHVFTVLCEMILQCIARTLATIVSNIAVTGIKFHGSDGTDYIHASRRCGVPICVRTVQREKCSLEANGKSCVILGGRLVEIRVNA